MKRNVKCIAQTINLSQPKICPRPLQVQKLVNTDVITPCPDSVRSPYKTPCRPVPIRICTRLDMERTLPPKMCGCLQKPAPETLGVKVCRWFKNLVKVGIASGLVYWTSAEGFWGDSEESEALYRRMIATLAPAFEEAVELDEINLPHLENVKHDIMDAYNRSVLKIVGLIAWAPLTLEEKIYQVLFPCNPNDQKKADIRKGGVK